MFLELLGDSRQPGQGPGSGVSVTGFVDSPAQQRGPVNGAAQLTPVDHAQQLRDGVNAGGGK
jgi:hypothetical protein